jgi:hypothetical protein
MANARNQSKAAGGATVTPISGGQATGSREPTPALAPRPAAPELPVAQASDLGGYDLRYYHPVVRLADGTEKKCPHQPYGHGDEKIAARCMRKLASEAGVRLA